MTRRPNIVLINCDDLGYGDLGCYGSTHHATPTLDRMAEDGMRFTDFYMASPVCSPSRAAMLTGCYPNRIGFTSLGGNGVLFPGHRYGLNPSEITIAKLLQGSGYKTMLIGKWHCGDQPEFFPTEHGFDSYYGIPYSNDMGPQPWPDHLPPVKEFFEKLKADIPSERPPLPLMLDDEVLEAQPDQAALTERYVEQAIRFLRTNRDAPFFLYFAHLYVHLPIYVQERFMTETSNGRYGGAVSCIDWSTAVILHELERLGLDDNTLVIFTSDNGALAREAGAEAGLGSNLPLRASKGTTWEGGQRVPCIMRWPGQIPAGVDCGEVATAMDLYPTLAGLAGVPVPDDRTLDGRDLADLILGADGAVSPHEQFLYLSRGSVEAIRVGRWKLHVRKGGDEICELYDLDADIAETCDLASANPDVVDDLSARIQMARSELGDEAMEIVGSGVRPIGLVDNPVTLTVFDDQHPYYIAEYDLMDRG